MPCSSCGSKEIALDAATFETYCVRCGLILETSIDYSMPLSELASRHHEATSYTMVNKGFPGEAANPVERNFAAALPALSVVWAS